MDNKIQTIYISPIGCYNLSQSCHCNIMNFDMSGLQDSLCSTIKPNSQTMPYVINKKPNLYELVTQYRKYTATPDLLRQQLILTAFIQNASKNVLFVFGPSGSGKHMLVNSFLDKHEIPYLYRAQLEKTNSNQNDATDNFENPYKKIKRTHELIIDSLNETNKLVHVYEQFPIINMESANKEIETVQNFRSNFFRILRKISLGKIIFILNSQIFNRYHILPKDYPEVTVQIMTLKPYTITDVKAILKHFTANHYQFEWIMKSKDTLDEIYELSSGDMRRVLLYIYKHTIESIECKMAYMSKDQKNEYKLKLKNEAKIPLFHMIGKYLYAKRFDNLQKKDRTFTKQQLTKYDPPFYFNPVDLFLKSTIPLSTFQDLLFENYTLKIATISDAIQINKLFCHLDSCFPAFITKRRVDSISEECQKLYIFLLTWGIILKNKSAAQVDKKFISFRKSESKQVSIELASKLQLLRSYFPFSRTSSLVNWGYIIRNSKIINKSYLIQNLIRKRNRSTTVLRDENEKVLDQEEEQQIIRRDEGNFGKEFVDSYAKRKKKKEMEEQLIKELKMEDCDSSDIDES